MILHALQKRLVLQSEQKLLENDHLFEIEVKSLRRGRLFAEYSAIWRFAERVILPMLLLLQVIPQNIEPVPRILHYVLPDLYEARLLELLPVGNGKPVGIDVSALRFDSVLEVLDGVEKVRRVVLLRELFQLGSV